MKLTMLVLKAEKREFTTKKGEQRRFVLVSGCGAESDGFAKDVALELPWTEVVSYPPYKEATFRVTDVRSYDREITFVGEPWPAGAK